MKRPWLSVLLGGLVAGTFDITYACTFWWLKRGVLLYGIMNYIVVPPVP